MTEEEAKTKWCPFARAAVMTQTDGVTIMGNRAVSETQKDIIQPPHNNCIGSACMAWRHEEGESVAFNIQRSLWPMWQPRGYIMLSEDETRDCYSIQKNPELAGGYCGLAGKP